MVIDAVIVGLQDHHHPQAEWVAGWVQAGLWPCVMVLCDGGLDVLQSKLVVLWLVVHQTGTLRMLENQSAPRAL